MSALKITATSRVNAAGKTELTLGLEGSLDNSTVAQLEGRLAAFLQTPTARVIFDLAGLKYVTSAGLRVFVATTRKQKQAGGRTTFIHLQPQIREVFEIMGSLPDMQVFENQAELDAYLLARQNSHEG
jgi:anti-anti-sigma factor